MSLTGRMAAGLRALFRSKRVERELDEELHHYLEAAAERNESQGMPRSEAMRAARAAIGSVEAVKEQVRDVGWESWVESLGQDVRYALRMLRKSPAFTSVAVLSLALGIGANTAIFTFLDALLLRTLPVRNPGELVELRASGYILSFPMYLDLRAGQQLLTDIAATQGVRNVRVTMTQGGRERVDLDNVPMAAATGNYFGLLGLQPAAGRFFTEDDDRGPGSSEATGSVVVLSDAFWARHFARDPQVVGRTLMLDRSATRIVGVAPRGFTGERIGAAPDLWVPIVPFAPRGNLEGRRGMFTAEIARLKPGVDREQAEAAMTALFQQLLKAEGIVRDDIRKYRIALTPARAGIDSGVRLRYETPLRIVMAIAIVVLLTACANLANLLVARGASRRGEIGVRLAIGCGRGRLIRQLLTESLVLSVIGAAAGAAVAYWGTQSLLGMLTGGRVPVFIDVTPSVRVLLFMVGVTLLTGVGFGVLPAIRSSRVDAAPLLQSGGRGHGGATSRHRLSRALVAVQVALSLLLLVGAGLLVATFRNLHGIDWGFRPERVVVFELRHNVAPTSPTLSTVAADVQARVGALPGVEAASVSWILLFSGTDQRSALRITGYTPTPAESATFAFFGENLVGVRYNAVSPGYFETVGMTVVAGRGLRDSDQAGAPQVAVINETMARRYFRAGQAVGGTFVPAALAGAGTAAVRVVGIVRDAKFNNLRADVLPMYYVSMAQVPRPMRGIEVRTRQAAGALAGQVRRVLADVSRDLTIERVLTLQDHVESTLGAERLMMRLASFFGGVALLLACIGLYGVIAYQVAQRSGEIGIRLALGATRRAIVRLMLSDTAYVVTAGVALGLALTFGATRMLSKFLFGLTPNDPTTIASAVALFVAAAAIAVYVPARRAAGVDPNVALRAE